MIDIHKALSASQFPGKILKPNFQLEGKCPSKLSREAEFRSCLSWFWARRAQPCAVGSPSPCFNLFLPLCCIHSVPHLLPRCLSATPTSSVRRYLSAPLFMIFFTFLRELAAEGDVIRMPLWFFPTWLRSDSGALWCLSSAGCRWRGKRNA